MCIRDSPSGEEQGGQGRPKSFHSFRHLFKNMGLNSGVNQEHLDEIQGHADNGVSSGYALDEDGMRYSQPVLFEAISKMRIWGIVKEIRILFDFTK